MKVTILCGGKFHAFNLAEQLDKRGYLHKLITSFYSPRRELLPEFRKDKERIESNKVITNICPEIIRRGFNSIPLIRNMASWNYYSLQAFDNWARSQIDKCDLFVGWSGYSLNTLRVARSHGAKIILERGSSHIEFQKQILEEEYEKYGIKNTPIDERIVQKELCEYEEADYISVPSEFVKQTFISKGFNPKKIIHVPYGVNLEHFKPAQKEDNIFRIVFVGGLTIRKGIHYLLEAFKDLKLKNSELLLIGSVSQEIKPFLKKCEDYYKYIGVVSHLKLYKYLSQSSVFVLPSIEEGLAMVIPQAMACALPVICTTNTGGADIVRDEQDGFIIPIRDVDSIKEKLIYLYKNPENGRSMGESALKRVSQGFTWDDYGEKITKSYLEILRNKSIR